MVNTFGIYFMMHLKFIYSSVVYADNSMPDFKMK